MIDTKTVKDIMLGEVVYIHMDDFTILRDGRIGIDSRALIYSVSMGPEFFKVIRGIDGFFIIREGP